MELVKAYIDNTSSVAVYYLAKTEKTLYICESFELHPSMISFKNARCLTDKQPIEFLLRDNVGIFRNRVQSVQKVEIEKTGYSLFQDPGYAKQGDFVKVGWRYEQTGEIYHDEGIIQSVSASRVYFTPTARFVDLAGVELIDIFYFSIIGG